MGAGGLPGERRGDPRTGSLDRPAVAGTEWMGEAVGALSALACRQAAHFFLRSQRQDAITSCRSFEPAYARSDTPSCQWDKR